jgi:hypothetical protein
MMLRALAIFANLVLAMTPTDAFSSSSPFTCSTAITTKSSSSSSITSLSMSEDENFMRWAKASRSAGVEDNVVELLRPLGLILNEDENGNVYVETVAPKGNAARTGRVRVVTGI